MLFLNIVPTRVLAHNGFIADDCSSAQLEVRSPKLSKVGFHTVEVLNPGGKCCRLEDVLYYTDDPALLAQDSNNTSPSRSSKAKEDSPSSLFSSAAARRVSGLFGRSYLSSSLSSAAALPSPQRASQPSAPKYANGLQATADAVSGEHLSPSSGELGPHSSIQTPTAKFSRHDSLSMSVNTKTSIQHEVSDVQCSEEEGMKPDHEPATAFGHTRSVSLDHVAFAKLAARRSARDNGYFWNVIDTEESTPSTSRSTGLSSSSSSSVPVSASRGLRWGTKQS